MNDLQRLRALTEIGMCVALAFALSFISIFQLPFGGKISLEMVPIFVMARFRGVRAGCATGFLFGLLDLLREPHVVHPAQFILDYPLPFAALGLAGLFPAGAVWDAVSMLAAGAVRFGCHFLSGVIFFRAYAPPREAVWKYSLVYNASYMIPSLIVTMLLVPPIVKALRHALPA